MSRWNPCCCGGVKLLPSDMVLVRAGWHHFMVMTKDGKVNTFISSGVRINGDGSSKFLTKGVASYSIVGKNGTNVGGTASCKVITEIGLNNLSSDANLDPTAWLLHNNGDQGDAPFTPAIWSNYYDSDGGLGFSAFGMISLYPEACLGWGGSTGVSAAGSDIGEYDGYYTPALGFANSPPAPVLIDGCPYYDIRGNPIDVDLYPHGYLNFDGSGPTIGRPPGTSRQKTLIEARGLCGSSGITLSTQIEGFDDVAIPAPTGHPLKVPQDLYDKLYPNLVENPDAIPEQVVDIECGAYHNIVRLKDNSIVCWGLNSMGQCNVPDSLKPDWSRPTEVTPHPKKNLICSIHAGFSTTAVLFNDGTVLCWGDPDVADVVNTWEHIRISPIKRHNNIDITCCNGAESDGYIDPVYPEFASNKYSNGTYNANTDWFGLWRTGKPAYPHFDLGIESNRSYPINWNDLQGAGVAPDSSLIPGYYCEVCNDSSIGGVTLGKDFAVAMLRTGQIVTTRKINARTPSATLCRDCDIDQHYSLSTGLITGMDIGPNIQNSSECRALAASTIPDQFTYCPDRSCNEYIRWELPLSYTDCSILTNTEGIGCFSSNTGLETTIHDANWADKTGFYTAGKQVRPTSHPNGAIPSWNTQDATYGWSTKVASIGRFRPRSDYQPLITHLTDPNTGLNCTTAVNLTPSKCIMDIGSTPCNMMCPSEGGWGLFKPSATGVPGFFSYPLHMAVSLTCVAGTNTVNWLYSPRTLSKTQVDAPISSGDGTVKGSSALVSDCVNYHAAKSGCGECDYVGGNPNYHFDEVASSTTSCIFASTQDTDGNYNPLKVNTAVDCGLPTLGGIIQYMLPSKPWGPWQLSTCSGIATPPYMEMTLCNFEVNRTEYCPYTTIRQNPVAYASAAFGFGGTEFGDADNVPGWFGLHYSGPTNLTISEEGVSPITRRAIRRDGGIWPISGPWKSVFFNPNTQAPCYYPPECNNPPPTPGEIPSDAGRYSGRCPKAPIDPTTPSEPLAYIDCYGYESTGPCAGGILGGQRPNVARYCYPDTFATTKMCYDDGGLLTCGTGGCDQGMGDTCNKWFFNNPCLSYATGRMFGVFVRRSAWYRGISGMAGVTSGEFIWEKTCSAIFDDTTPKDFTNLGWDRLFEGIQGTKLWITGLMHDPCPPWPLKDDLTGATYGVYPSWVPVPTASRSARKGSWTGSVGSKVWQQVGFTGATGYETTINISAFNYDASVLTGLTFTPPYSSLSSIPDALRTYIT